MDVRCSHTVERGKVMEVIEEAVIEEGAEENEWLPGDDRFYTLTIAEILERQGFKKDALKIYHGLLKKGGQDSLIIKERIERLTGDKDTRDPSVQVDEKRRKNFINWVEKVKKGSGGGI